MERVGEAIIITGTGIAITLIYIASQICKAIKELNETIKSNKNKEQ
jgi:hypothetical protein